MLAFKRDLPAVIGSRSGASCDKYDLARILWTDRKIYGTRLDATDAGQIIVSQAHSQTLDDLIKFAQYPSFVLIFG